jgi:hypothetical protein
MGRLKHQPKPESRFEPWLSEFDDYMRNERGLSTVTRSGRRWVVSRFLDRMVTSGNAPTSLTIADVDRYFRTPGNCKTSFNRHARWLYFPMFSMVSRIFDISVINSF